MQIDNPNEALALTKKLQDTLPIQAYLGPQSLKMMHDRGEAMTPNTLLTIEMVNYSGDMGGIMCTLAKETGTKERYVLSLTHLKIDPNHPLAAEVQAYQQQRVRRLKLQDQKSVISELRQMDLGRSTKPKRGKGFTK